MAKEYFVEYKKDRLGENRKIAGLQDVSVQRFSSVILVVEWVVKNMPEFS